MQTVNFPPSISNSIFNSARCEDSAARRTHLKAPVAPSTLCMHRRCCPHVPMRFSAGVDRRSERQYPDNELRQSRFRAITPAPRGRRIDHEPQPRCCAVATVTHRTLAILAPSYRPQMTPARPLGRAGQRAPGLPRLRSANAEAPLSRSFAKRDNHLQQRRVGDMRLLADECDRGASSNNATESACRCQRAAWPRAGGHRQRFLKRLAAIIAGRSTQ